ncbi:polysaccharide pyruvyl transferase family protein [Bacteroides faecis]|nr:polysaccharide pyruvyl transferase family protein [Bacteroides faecis]
MDAKLVVTDSFHACVFAIIFNKPFICIGNNKRGMARFQSLLDLFGLQQCLINIEQLYEIPNINWEKINLKLEKLRKYSLFSLEQALIN